MGKTFFGELENIKDIEWDKFFHDQINFTILKNFFVPEFITAREKQRYS